VSNHIDYNHQIREQNNYSAGQTPLGIYANNAVNTTDRRFKNKNKHHQNIIDEN